MLAKPTFLKKFRHKRTGATVTLFDDFEAGRTERQFRPQHPMAYVLRSGVDGRTVFRGRDYGCSPMHAIDGLDCLAALLGFLTLQPGDTDAEYFADYTDRQTAWAASGEAQELSMWCYDRENARS